MDGFMLIFLLLAAGTWFAAALGAATVAFIRKESSLARTLILGFAAGVILMVSFVELIHPAIHLAEYHSSLPAWLVVPGAFTMGFLCVLFFDVGIRRFKLKKENAGQSGFMYRQGTVLLGALSVHNVPEGLAFGVLLGTIGRHFLMEELLAVIPFTLAIALHKLPEGAAISVAFQKEGLGKIKSFLLGQFSGLLGFASGVFGFAVAVGTSAAMPYAMAFAGGAMVWVAVHELIPESNKNKEKHPYLASLGVFLGVLLMLFVDIGLHDHHHMSASSCHSYHDHRHD